MLLTNHVLTGTFLGLSIDNPAILFPAGVASHLAMDMVPHFGFTYSIFADGRKGFQDLGFIIVGGLDFAVATSVVIGFCLARPDRAGHILIGALGAALPDLTYIPAIIFGERVYRWFPWLKRLIFGFLAPIQWFEKPIGLMTEVVWLALITTLLRYFT